MRSELHRDLFGSRTWSRGEEHKVWDTESGRETWQPHTPWSPPAFPPSWDRPVNWMPVTTEAPGLARPEPTSETGPRPVKPVKGLKSTPAGQKRYWSPTDNMRNRGANLIERNTTVFCYLGPSHTVPLQYIKNGLCDHAIVWGLWIESGVVFFDETWLFDVAKWRDTISPETVLGIGIGGTIGDNSTSLAEILGYFIETYSIGQFTVDTQDGGELLFMLMEKMYPNITTVLALPEESVNETNADMILLKTDWPAADPRESTLNLVASVERAVSMSKLPAERLAVSIPTFGKSFMDLKNGTFLPLEEPISYGRICKLFDIHSVHNRRFVTPTHEHSYADRGHVVTIYNDPYSLKHQVDILKGIVGAVALFVGYDDYYGVCGEVNMPLLKSILQV